MNIWKYVRYVRNVTLTIAILPFVLIILGSVLNQIVMLANGSMFPVKANPVRAAVIINHYNEHNALNGIDMPMFPIEVSKSYLLYDTIHCQMTKDTHLNFLADWIDTDDGIESIGDVLIDLGNGLVIHKYWFILVTVLLYLKPKKEQNANKYFNNYITIRTRYS